MCCWPAPLCFATQRSPQLGGAGRCLVLLPLQGLADERHQPGRRDHRHLRQPGAAGTIAGEPSQRNRRNHVESDLVVPAYISSWLAPAAAVVWRVKGAHVLRQVGSDVGAALLLGRVRICLLHAALLIPAATSPNAPTQGGAGGAGMRVRRQAQQLLVGLRCAVEGHASLGSNCGRCMRCSRRR